MKVYRFMFDDELHHLKNGEYDKLGETYKNHKKYVYNTHKYDENVRYLHFFKNIEDFKFIQMFYRNVNKDGYLVTFDIPALILLHGKGKGYYPAVGYEEDYSEIVEYAIPSSKINNEWIKDIKKIEKTPQTTQVEQDELTN